MTMYKLLRNTHLLAGTFAFLFLLMYGVSSVQMSHPAYFNSRPATSDSEIPMEAGVASPRDLARRLMDSGAVRGDLVLIQTRPDGYSFRVTRPGTVHEVTYSSASGATKIRTNVAGFIGMLNRIHHVNGLWHEFTLTNLWGLFTGVTATLLIVLALTGIYLWFKIHGERVIGSILLAVSLAFSLTLIVLIRTA